MSQSSYLSVSTNPEASQSNFINQFDVGSPEKSISEYMRYVPLLRSEATARY